MLNMVEFKYRSLSGCVIIVYDCLFLLAVLSKIPECQSAPLSRAFMYLRHLCWGANSPLCIIMALLPREVTDLRVPTRLETCVKLLSIQAACVCLCGRGVCGSVGLELFV